MFRSLLIISIINNLSFQISPLNEFMYLFSKRMEVKLGEVRLYLIRIRPANLSSPEGIIKGKLAGFPFLLSSIGSIFKTENLSPFSISIFVYSLQETNMTLLKIMQINTNEFFMLFSFIIYEMILLH